MNKIKQQNEIDDDLLYFYMKCAQAACRGNMVLTKKLLRQIELLEDAAIIYRI